VVVGSTNVVVVLVLLGVRIFIPLFHRSFLPLSTHVYLIPPIIEIFPFEEQVVPGFVEADDVPETITNDDMKRINARIRFIIEL
jgi:hypothetical protein